MKANGERPSAVEVANRSGSNFSGLGNTLASICMAWMNIFTTVPLRIIWLPIGNKSQCWREITVDSSAKYYKDIGFAARLFVRKLTTYGRWNLLELPDRWRGLGREYALIPIRLKTIISIKLCRDYFDYTIQISHSLRIFHRTRSFAIIWREMTTFHSEQQWKFYLRKWNLTQHEFSLEHLDDIPPDSRRKWSQLQSYHGLRTWMCRLALEYRLASVFPCACVWEDCREIPDGVFFSCPHYQSSRRHWMSQDVLR